MKKNEVGMLKVAGLLLLSGVFFLAASMVSGCATNVQPSQEVSLTRVKAIVKLAAYGSARVILIDKPEARYELEKARNGFAGLIAAEDWTFASVSLLAMDSGLEEIEGAEGIVKFKADIAVGILLVDLIAGQTYNLRDQVYVEAVVTGAYDGLVLALGTGKPDQATVIDAQLKAEAQSTR